jgi:hypothetical protein
MTINLINDLIKLLLFVNALEFSVNLEFQIIYFLNKRVTEVARMLIFMPELFMS